MTKNANPERLFPGEDDQCKASVHIMFTSCYSGSLISSNLAWFHAPQPNPPRVATATTEFLNRFPSRRPQIPTAGGATTHFRTYRPVQGMQEGLQAIPYIDHLLLAGLATERVACFACVASPHSARLFSAAWSSCWCFSTTSFLS